MLAALETKVKQEDLLYTGAELRPHFLLAEFGLRGHAIGVFMGPCLVKTSELVDWEDRLSFDRIEAKRMIHFIGEFFGLDLQAGVWLQRLMMAACGEVLSRVLSSDQKVTRSGDDLFVDDRKLSVSIVTASPVSVLMHIGINIDPAGAPVPAIGLDELKVDSQTFVSELLAMISEEWKCVQWACTKVRPVV